MNSVLYTYSLMKKGLNKDDQKYIKTISINSINNGNGMYNV